MATRRKAGAGKTSSSKAPARKPAARKKAAKKTTSRKAATKKRASKKRPGKRAKKAATSRKPTRLQTRELASKAGKKAHQVRKAPTRKAATKKAKPAPAAGTVVQIHRYTEVSITQLSLDTGITRKTIRKRLARANVTEARLEKGYPVYRLKDVLPALFTESDGTTDPDKLQPFERRAYYQGEKEKLGLAEARGELVPAFEVERTFAVLFKTLTQALETLPDVLERDAGIQGPALVLVEEKIDELRNTLYGQVIEADPDADSADALSA